MTMNSGWIAVQQHIVGNLANYGYCYDWDGKTFPTRRAARDHGFKAFGSDDFNLGRVDRGRLVWWGWMSKAHVEDIDAAAVGLGLTR